MMDILFAVGAWHLCGVAGFLYWWTEDFALDRRTLGDAAWVGAMGPFAIVGGFLIHHIAGSVDRMREGAAVPAPVRVRAGRGAGRR